MKGAQKSYVLCVLCKFWTIQPLFHVTDHYIPNFNVHIL